MVITISVDAELDVVLDISDEAAASLAQWRANTRLVGGSPVYPTTGDLFAEIIRNFIADIVRQYPPVSVRDAQAALELAREATKPVKRGRPNEPGRP